MFTKWMQSKKLRLNYKIDDAAHIAIIYVNKDEKYWTAGDKDQIDRLTAHFTQLKYAVMVED